LLPVSVTWHAEFSAHIPVAREFRAALLSEELYNDSSDVRCVISAGMDAS
jgi:hypothetical protein